MSAIKLMQAASALNRRTLLKAAAAAGTGLAFPHIWTGRASAADPIEIVHWSWLAASDGEVWAKMIQNFNDAHKDKGVQIRMEVVPEEQYVTKVLAAAATGKAPDFGWGTAGKGAQLAARRRDGAARRPRSRLPGSTSPTSANPRSTASRYPKYDNKIFMVPMDLMSLQPEINLDHVKEAGLDPNKPPADGEALHRMGQGDDQARRRQGHPLRHHDDRLGRAADGDLGHRRRRRWASSAPATTSRRPASIPRPARRRCSGCSTCSTSTRCRRATSPTATRPSAPGRARSSGPARGRSTAMSSRSCLSRPRCSRRSATSSVTYFERGGLELYTQPDTGRYEATMQAVKWLSDNSFLWTTVGRGASPRKSILDRPDYKTAGTPWDVRGAFVDGMSFATRRRDPGRRRPGLHDLFRRQFPGQDAGGRVVRADDDRRRHEPDPGAVAVGPRRGLIRAGPGRLPPGAPSRYQPRRRLLTRTSASVDTMAIAIPDIRDRRRGRTARDRRRRLSAGRLLRAAVLPVQHPARAVRRLCRLHALEHRRRAAMGRHAELHEGLPRPMGARRLREHLLLRPDHRARA